MITKVNFGSENSALPRDEFILDFGRGYSTVQGYGWVTQASLDSDAPIPIDISANTRDRDVIDEQSTDTLIHLQYPSNLPGTRAAQSIKTPSAWEYDLENGTYQITVSVGDTEFTDSNHAINIEGESVIAGFTPTEGELFTEVTTTVEVTDGRLTLDAIGGENTKLNFVEIVSEDSIESGDSDSDIDENTTPEAIIPDTDGDSDGEGDTPIDPDGIGSDTLEETDNSGNVDDTDTSEDTGGEVAIPVEGGGVVEIVEPISAGINFNFGVPRVDSPSGFTQDIGEAYDAERGYGWVTQDSAGSANLTPIDLVVNGRDRDTLFNDGFDQFAEPVRDSLIHTQYPTGLSRSSQSVTTPAAWEYEIANGQYEVTVGVGDSEFFDSNHVVNVEGESLISGFVPTGFPENGNLPIGAQAFSKGTATIEVTDGSLTLDSIGGENTKVNFISIVPVNAV